MESRVGIFMIGSLYWGVEDGRALWREARLDMKQKWFVRAPIRYGRKSEERGGTYTMVFSRLASNELGRAVVVKCRQSIRNADGLMIEARWLWSAERKRVPKTEADLPDKISADWGRVALLVRPNGCARIPLNALTSRLDHELLHAWSQRAGSRDDELLVCQDGLLRIDWPICIDDGAQVPLDFLLATTNRPCRTLPDATSVALAWKSNPKERAYFDNNRSAGIATFQDSIIAQHLQEERKN